VVAGNDTWTTWVVPERAMRISSVNCEKSDEMMVKSGVTPVILQDNDV